MARFLILAVGVLALAQPASAQPLSRSDLEPVIARHAAANRVPAALVHRVIARESNYNPRAISPGNTMGLMQIKPATARRMGYRGDASGLLDPETNLTYAVRYLAGAYRAAGGNEQRAIAYYMSGYHDQAPRAHAADRTRPPVAMVPVPSVAPHRRRAQPPQPAIAAATPRPPAVASIPVRPAIAPIRRAEAAKARQKPRTAKPLNLLRFLNILRR